MLYTCSVVYIWCCVHVFVVLCTDGVACLLDMRCCVKWCWVHVGYVMLCTYGALCMFHMWCCVHMELYGRCGYMYDRC